MKLSKFKIFSIVAVCMWCIFSVNVYAASVTLSGAASGNPNSAVNITISGDFTGRVNLSSSNGTLSKTSVWIESNSQTITVTLGASGTTTITATPAIGTSDPDGNMITVPANSKSIAIKEPVVENNNNNNNNNVTPPANNLGTTTNNNTTNNTNTSNKKSSNANLKSMILNVEGLSPAFAKNITTYSVNVGENINEIKVNASVEHKRASYSVTGNTNLKEGENIVSVRVVAEDGTVKTYTINVLKSDDPVKSDATLSSLIIEDVDLGQAFDPNITEYNAGEITVKSDKLNIYAYTTSDNAKVEIIGNENLQIGDNKITVRVTSENGKVVKDYIISFNKLYSNQKADTDISALKDDKADTSFWDNIKDFYNDTLKENMTVIILYIFIWVEFIQVMYLYQRLKKYENLDKITVSNRLKNLYVREMKKEPKKKVEKTRRNKVNPIFQMKNKKIKKIF